MGELSRECRLPAIKSDGHLASDAETDCQTDSESSDWFGKLARPLLAGSDAGFALHLVTGFQTGTCARYVSKSPQSRRQPPGWFIVSLLRSEQGETWESAFMGDAKPKWWIERESDRTKAKMYDCICLLVAVQQQQRYLKAERIYNALAAELRE